MGILPVPVLLAGKMPAPQEILDISLIGSLLAGMGIPMKNPLPFPELFLIITIILHINT